MWNYRASLLNVHDGDTLTLLIDLGFNARFQGSIRLKGVFAPELSQPGGVETKNFLLDYFTKNQIDLMKWPLILDTEITNTTEPTEKMTFTRYVGTLWSGSVSINNMINEFLAAHPEWPHGIGA